MGRDERLLMPWDGYEVDGYGKYIYVPGDPQMPTFNAADMLDLLQDYQDAIAALEAALKDANAELELLRELESAVVEWLNNPAKSRDRIIAVLAARGESISDGPPEESE